MIAAATHAANKRRFFDYTQAFNRRGTTAEAALADLLSPDAQWTGSAPIDDLCGDQVFEVAYRPLFTACPDLERIDELILGGEFDGKAWVATLGHYVGTFTTPLFDIPATGGVLSLRYGEVYEFEDGQVTHAYAIWDLLDVMVQAGVSPLPPALGTEMRWPAPNRGQDVLSGLSLTEPDPETSAATLALTEDMLFKGLRDRNPHERISRGSERYWSTDMMWYGPAGIGSTRGIDGFQRFHQTPFLVAMPDRVGGNHKARFADGHYSISTGWPSLSATLTGSGWLGLPATNTAVKMRVLDVWRRGPGRTTDGGVGDRLCENWVFIDLIDLFGQVGIDLFEQMRVRL